MAESSFQYDEIKHRIRKLKKLEIKIRFGNIDPAEKPYAVSLVWDSFFNLHEGKAGNARYSIHQLAAMNKEEYRSVVDEFFFHVYFKYYKENGIVNVNIYDPTVLTQLGLSLDADYAAVKKKFRELAMRFHPDTGGDAAKFIELMENYNKLIEKGK